MIKEIKAISAHHDGVLGKQGLQEAGVVQHDGAAHDVEEVPQVIRVLQILARLPGRRADGGALAHD